MKIIRFNDNQLDQSSYLIRKQDKAVIFDPGFNGLAILDFLKEKEIKEIKVILTHGHFDHIKGIEVLAKEYDYDLLVSPHDKTFLFEETFNYAKNFGSSFNLPKLNIIEVTEQTNFNYIDRDFIFIETPGHTKGSICIKIDKHLISGDTLFYNSIGRTDLYSGNQTTLFNSLKKLINKLSNDTMIYPGHGPIGLLKDIKEINPYI